MNQNAILVYKNVGFINTTEFAHKIRIASCIAATTCLLGHALLLFLGICLADLDRLEWSSENFDWWAFFLRPPNIFVKTRGIREKRDPGTRDSGPIFFNLNYYQDQNLNVTKTPHVI